MVKLSKQDYINAFKKELMARDGKIQELDLDTITVHSIWKNPTAKGGMRLTQLGWKVLNDCLNFESWTFQINDEDILIMPANKILLNLDRHLDCPYFVSGGNRAATKVHIFNAKLATAIAIQGSIIKFINVREQKNKNTSD